MGAGKRQIRGGNHLLRALSSLAGGTTYATESLRLDSGPLRCVVLRNEADAHAANTQELLQAIREHEQTEGLMIINYREPKCRSTFLPAQAQHWLRRAAALQRGWGDTSRWMVGPIPGSEAASGRAPQWMGSRVAAEPAKACLPGQEGWRSELPKR